MNVIRTAISEVLIVEPKVFGDPRGFFVEIFKADRYAAHRIGGPFVQDNLSRSSCRVLRGLHLQNPKMQGKLVTVLRGSVLDVAVDVRVGSPTFGRHVAVELSEDNGRQLWVPRGFAHGFVVLSESADFFYKCATSSTVPPMKSSCAGTILCSASTGASLHPRFRTVTLRRRSWLRSEVCRPMGWADTDFAQIGTKYGGAGMN